MTRSIFDPDSGETERSGSTFTGPDAEQISQLPPDITDGKVDPEESAEHGEENPAEEADDTIENMERPGDPNRAQQNRPTEG